MLETCTRQAHAPLPASRLDMRACHPAFSKAADRVSCEGFPRPTPGFHGSGANLLHSPWQASLLCGGSEGRGLAAA